MEISTFSLVTVFYGLLLGIIYRAMSAVIDQKEQYLLEEIDALKQNLEDEKQLLQQQFENIINSSQNIPSPSEQMELIRSGMLNNLMGMGVQWIGKRFGLDMGVHQLESPEAPDATGGVLKDIMEEL